MLFKRSFVIHLCCQIIYSVREINHFPKHKNIISVVNKLNIFFYFELSFSFEGSNSDFEEIKIDNILKYFQNTIISKDLKVMSIFVYILLL